MSTSSSASAPGKVILLGEHSVVFGVPAIAAAIDRRLEVRVQFDGAASAHSSSDPKLQHAVEVAARDLDVDPAQLRVEVASDIPPACGLGSSAALSLALVRALAPLGGRTLSDEEIRARASRVEDVFHGTASGVDVAASASGGVVWFERSNPPTIEPLRPARPIDLVVGLSGDPRSTAGPVGRLRERHAKRPELYGRLFDLAGHVVRAGREALETGDWESLGTLMDTAQGLLNAFGVSTPALERMLAIARGAGALGAKLSGAGGGGVIIALAPASAERIAEALRAAGFEAFHTRIGSATPQEGPYAKSNRRSA
jgi:mevalonate kinase